MMTVLRQAQKGEKEAVFASVCSILPTHVIGGFPWVSLKLVEVRECTLTDMIQ